MKVKLILLIVGIVSLTSSCGSSSSKQTASTTTTGEELTPVPENLSDEPIVEIQTSMGNIKVKLYKDTPIHRDNFIKLVSKGFYSQVLFHRVIKDFMIQAGDPESVNAPAEKQLGSGDPGYTIPAEILPNHFHKKGVLSAARKGDNVNPNKESSGSQFYVVQGSIWDDARLNQLEEKTGVKYTEEQRKVYKTVGGAPHLDGAYTVFGEVVEGLDVVDAIAAVETGQGDRPVVDVKIIKAVIVE